MNRAWAIVVLAAASACSFTVIGPRDDYLPERHGAPVCNDSIGGAGAIDVLGVLFGSIVTYAALDAATDSGDDGTAQTYAAIGAVGTALHVTALVGAFSKTKKCREARTRYKQHARIVNMPPTPGPPRRAHCFSGWMARSCHEASHPAHREAPRKEPPAEPPHPEPEGIGPPGMTEPSAPPDRKCARDLARWRAEADLVRKTVLFGRLAPDCRAHVTRPASGRPDG